MKKKICFVCTGNYYRSRYAEAYMSHLSDLLNLSLECLSAGFEISKADRLSEMYGEMSPFTKKELDHKQILGLASKERRALTDQDIDSSDLLIILDEEEHKKYLKNYNIGDWSKLVYWNVKDIDDWVPKVTLDVIEINCQKLASEIWNEKF